MRPTTLFPALRAVTLGVLISQLVLPVGILAQQTAVAQQKAEAQQTAVAQAPTPQQDADPHGRQAITMSQAPPLAVDDTSIAHSAKQTTHLSMDNSILLALDRFTYGPRPGDLERVRAMGLNEWFHQQFNPAMLNDSAMDERLLAYPAMKMPLNRMLAEFLSNREIRAAVNRDAATPDADEAGRAVLRVREEEYALDEKNKKAEAAKPADTMMAAADDGAKKKKLPDAEELPLPLAQLLAMPPDDRFKQILKMDAGQLRTLFQNMKDSGGEADLTAGFTPRQVETLMAFRGPTQVIGSEAVQTKILRDIYSERQLQEVMIDFWLNHFNVYLQKSQEAPYYIAAYERDVIRPYALGRFSDLLLATAQSPAMLDYLDQRESVGPNSRSAYDSPNKKTGLNENYAREVMELHTVGVNGGYTQKDVTELAKVFTGWTVQQGNKQETGTRPIFDDSKHEPGNKVVLGHTFRNTGLDEGFDALKMLAATPQCARFISTKLAVRFMGDQPPAAVVNRMAAAFTASNGNIRQVLAAMVNSPEFFTQATYRAKVKTPQDYVISAVRATGSEVTDPGALAKAISDLGMPLYGHQTPDGYAMRSDAWNSTNALVSRMNFAMALASNRVAGVHTDFTVMLGVNPSGLSAKEKQDRIEARLLQVPVSIKTEQLIQTETNLPPGQQQAQLRQVASLNGNMRYGKGGNKHPNAGKGSMPPIGNDDPSNLDMQAALATGLVLGSPEFQRR